MNDILWLEVVLRKVQNEVVDGFLARPPVLGNQLDLAGCKRKDEVSLDLPHEIQFLQCPDALMYLRRTEAGLLRDELGRGIASLRRVVVVRRKLDED